MLTPIDSLNDGLNHNGRGTYIRFWHDPDWLTSHKTRRWCITAVGGNMLGEVKWYAPWRKYALFPGVATVYEEICLTEIAEFCKSRTMEHKEKTV